MTYKSKIIAILLIFSVINNTHCSDGGKPATLNQGLMIAAGTLLINNLPKMISYLKNKFITETSSKSVIANPVYATLEEIEFQKVQNFFDACELTGVKNKDHKKEDFNIFIDLVEKMNNKTYTPELSKVVLNCATSSNEKSFESIYERYSRCIKNANELAADKKSSQSEPTIDDKPKTDDPQN